MAAIRVKYGPRISTAPRRARGGALRSVRGTRIPYTTMLSRFAARVMPV
jgi:hypothetical protein